MKTPLRFATRSEINQTLSELIVWLASARDRLV